MNPRKDAQFIIRLPQELLDAAKRKSDQVDIPISQYLRHCLMKWVEEEPPQATKEDESPGER